MIADSTPWKRELTQLAGELARIRRRGAWTDAAGFRVERALLLGFFVIRRLHESHKLTDRTANTGVTIRRYATRGPPPDQLNWHRLGEHFDVAAGHAERVPLRKFYNQVIHSFVLVLDVRRAPAVFVASDWERRRSIQRVALVEVERLFRKVAADNVRKAKYERDEEGNDFIVTLM